jgi:hypothetical protein
LRVLNDVSKKAANYVFRMHFGETVCLHHHGTFTLKMEREDFKAFCVCSSFLNIGYTAVLYHWGPVKMCDRNQFLLTNMMDCAYNAVVV